jgi:hypothetical protein
VTPIVVEGVEEIVFAAKIHGIIIFKLTLWETVTQKDTQREAKSDANSYEPDK